MAPDNMRSSCVNGFLCALLFSTALFSIAAVSGASASPAPIVHAGDTLGVNVLNYGALIDNAKERYKGLQVESIVVAGDGSISLPIVGTVHVAGKTTHQIASVIERRLAQYVRDPAVTVDLIQQNPVLFLTGATVGTLSYLPGETVSTALGQLRDQLEKNTAPVQSAVDKAGPVLTRSDLDLRKIGVKRDGRLLDTINGEELLRTGLPGLPLVPGDTLVFVDKPIRVDVRGQVATPGSVYLYGDDTLEKALLDAGGPLATASTVDASLVRNGVESPLALGSAAIRQAPQDGDKIVVRSAPHISVLGQVEKPGDFMLTNGNGLLIALYTAGGPTRWANVHGIEIVHGGSHVTYDLSRLQHGDLSLNVPLSDGDVVYVPEGHAIDTRLFFTSLLGALGGAYDISQIRHPN